MNEQLLKQMESMSKTELFNALYCDEMTGTGNRRAMENRLTESDVKTVAIVDMDSLKFINDTFGHLRGDKFLQELAAILIDTFGQSNVFRIGGDEFAVTFESNKRHLFEMLVACREKFPGVSFGCGNTLAIADQNLNSDKDRRERLGTRAKRGLCPYWLQKELLNRSYLETSAAVSDFLA